MRKFVLFSCFLFIAATNFAAEKYVYDMFLFGNNIGRMTILRELKADGIEHITVSSFAKAKILWTERSQKTNYDVVYQNGKLISSSHSYSENNGDESYCKVKLDGNKYTVVKNGKTFTLSETPNFTVMNMYFTEPKNIKRVFYEPQGTFSDIKSTAPSVYEFKSSDGNRNVYYFKNGSLDEMEFHVSLIIVKAKRVS